MRADIPDHWLHPGTLARARLVQEELATLVLDRDEPDAAAGLPQLIAGADVSTAFRDSRAPIHAGVVLLAAPDLAQVAAAGASALPDFPYVPGYLGFREAPALIEAFRQLPSQPALVLVDGHGLAHPRGLGVASHLGVLLDLPTIGVAKSVLVGEILGTLGDAPGSAAPLAWRGRTLGMALRSRARANPIYVSVGHRVSLPGAVRHVQSLLRGYRLPEPTRLAHAASNRQRVSAG